MRHTPLSLACLMLLAYTTSLRGQVTTTPSSGPTDAPVAIPNTNESQYQSNAQLVQLVPGTTIVTAYTNPEGDAESIKQVVSHDARGLRFHYSSKSPKGTDISVYRLVPDEDTRAARMYQIWFANNFLELLPGSTSLGVSSDILRTLKSGEKADAQLVTLSSSSLSGSGYYEVIDAQDVPVRVVVNDKEVDLPAVHVRGIFGSEQGEFWFLARLIHDRADLGWRR